MRKENLSYSYDTSLKFNPEYVESIVSGKKQTTIRYSENKIRLPKRRIIPLYNSNKGICNEKSLICEAEITNFKVCKFKSLNFEDAINDGFKTKELLINTLRQIYPQILDEDFITIYSFSIIKNV
jgi:hypothetical protein